LHGLEILSKNSAKLWFFFSKNFDIFEIKNFTKIHRLLFLFYFFNIFDICFFYFTYPKLSKNYGISWSAFYWKD